MTAEQDDRPGDLLGRTHDVTAHAPRRRSAAAARTHQPAASPPPRRRGRATADTGTGGHDQADHEVAGREAARRHGAPQALVRRRLPARPGSGRGHGTGPRRPPRWPPPPERAVTGARPGIGGARRRGERPATRTPPVRERPPTAPAPAAWSCMTARRRSASPWTIRPSPRSSNPSVWLSPVIPTTSASSRAARVLPATRAPRPGARRPAHEPRQPSHQRHQREGPGDVVEGAGGAERQAGEEAQQGQRVPQEGACEPPGPPGGSTGRSWRRGERRSRMGASHRGRILHLAGRLPRPRLGQWRGRRPLRDRALLHHHDLGAGRGDPGRSRLNTTRPASSAGRCRRSSRRRAATVLTCRLATS